MDHITKAADAAKQYAWDTAQAHALIAIAVEIRKFNEWKEAGH